MSALSHVCDAYDAVVIGARCAGAATAMQLARRGLRVLAVDRGRHGSDTLSTHALMRAGVLQLSRWGVLDAVVAAGTPAVRHAVFHYADQVVEVPVKPRNGVAALYAPRRTVLDALLVDAAVDSGADVVHGVSLAGLIRDQDDRVTGVTLAGSEGGTVEVRADIVIGADGTRSKVARLVDARPYHVARHATGVVYGYWSGLDIHDYHFYYRPGVSAGAIPTNDGQVCVFASMPSSRFQREVRLDAHAAYLRVIAETEPALAVALAGARQVSSLRGYAGEPGYFRQSWGPGWALVGDAGYFKDPITAHGISDALRDAELLARAVATRTDTALEEYQVQRDDLGRRFHDTTDDIASFEWTLDEVQRMHRTLSEEMAREVTFIGTLDATSPTEARPGWGSRPYRALSGVGA
jgi:flavin-dependent dehydrogenase